jgi:hypothetical protein
MEKQNSTPKTLGQVIDELIGTLGELEESARVTAIKAVCEHLKIGPPEILEPKPGISAGGTTRSDVVQRSQITDVKTLRENKKPTSANEMAAVVAYYLLELAPPSEKKSDVGVDDMVKYFNQGRYPLPRQPRVLLQNAKNAGYFESIGKGKYRLNPVGYNLVAYNLPKQIPGSTRQKSVSRKKGTKRMKTKK